MTRRLLLALLFLICGLLPHVPRRAIVGGAPVSPLALAVDDDTVVGLHDFTRGYPADHPDGSVNAVIEIPAGTTAKFETGEDGALHWSRDRDTGARRAIDYLPYVVNYGSVPRTLAPDGDALDIVVLGAGIERGHVIRTRVIGVLKMLDVGDIHDDKLISVPLDHELRNGFSRLLDLDELDAGYAEVRRILWSWFASYWGAGATHLAGWGDAAEAREILQTSKRAFTSAPTAALAASALRPAAPRPCVAHAR